MRNQYRDVFGGALVDVFTGGGFQLRPLVAGMFADGIRMAFNIAADDPKMRKLMGQRIQGGALPILGGVALGALAGGQWQGALSGASLAAAFGLGPVGILTGGLLGGLFSRQDRANDFLKQIRDSLRRVEDRMWAAPGLFAAPESAYIGARISGGALAGIYAGEKSRGVW